MKEHLNKYVSVLIVLVVLILLYIGSIVLKKNTTTAPAVTDPGIEQGQDQTDQNPPQEQPADSSQFTYKYVANYKDNGGFTEQNYDGKIVKTDTKSNQTTVVIPSVKQAYPKLKSGINLSLQQLNTSSKLGNIYFTVVLMESDSGMDGIIKFDPQTNKLTELKTSGYFKAYSAAASETSPYAASILTPAENMNNKDPKKLYLMDLDNDSVKTLTTLPNGQTFNYCYNGFCMFDVMPEINWLNGSEFEVTVFSTTLTEKDEYGNIMSKRIKKLKFNVNQ